MWLRMHLAMKTKSRAILHRLNFTFVAALLATSQLTTFAQGTAFTYQGQLNTNGVPFSGSAAFQLTLWDSVSGGNAVATNNPVSFITTATNGLFTATLDFGIAPFNGQPRFLQT